MKGFRKIEGIIFIIIIFIWIAGNIIILHLEKSESGRPYRVEIRRIALEIEEKGLDHISLSEYKYVTDIKRFGKDFYNSDSDYIIYEIDGTLYRFDYLYKPQKNKRKRIVSVNILIIFMSCIVVFVMLFVQYKIIPPVRFKFSKNSSTFLTNGV